MDLMELAKCSALIKWECHRETPCISPVTLYTGMSTYVSGIFLHVNASIVSIS